MVEFQDYSDRQRELSDQEFKHSRSFSAPLQAGSSSGSWGDCLAAESPERNRSRLPSLEDLAAQGFLSAGKGRLKVDITTPFEQVIMGGLIVCGIGLFIALITLGDIPGWVPFSALMGLLSFLMLHRSTDNYYYLDIPRRELGFHHQSIFYNGEWVVAPFKKIAATTSNGVKKKSKHSSWWEYGTILALENGKHFPISDYVREDLLQANTKARLLAEVIGCTYAAGRLECEAKIKTDPLTGKVSIEHHPRSFLVELLPVLVVLVVFGLISLLASLF